MFTHIRILQLPDQKSFSEGGRPYLLSLDLVPWLSAVWAPALPLKELITVSSYICVIY